VGFLNKIMVLFYFKAFAGQVAHLSRINGQWEFGDCVRACSVKGL